MAELQEFAAQEAAAALNRFNRSFSGKYQRCCSRPGLLDSSTGEVLNVTVGRKWRYFSLLECGAAPGSGSQRVCLVFKENVAEGKVSSMSSSDGLDFRPFPPPAIFGDGSPFRRNERLLSHNLALLRASPPDRPADFIMLGGMGPATLRAGKTEEGIRLIRGPEWPWRNSSWSTPRVVISGHHPPGCLDRRPSRVPFEPQATDLGPPACEFDGRLSLVHHDGAYRVFARANLWENALSGGRFVQTTSSVDGVTWSPWKLIRIQGVHTGLADIYFFAAQPNPVDPSSLIALFPLMQPPHACIAVAVSFDGVQWWSTRSLRRSPLGWRTRENDGSGPMEWRGEDHPVASGVIDMTGYTKADGSAHDKGWLHIYLHHAVSGMSMARRGPAHVARYRLPMAALRRLTRQAAAESKQAARARKSVVS